MASADVGIIGGSPAGLTAATLARQIYSAVVLDSGAYRNVDSHHMHTVPGWEHKDPKEFRKTTRAQVLERYETIQFVDSAVSMVEKKSDSSFVLTDGKGKMWEVKKVILAVGSSDVLPDIERYSRLLKKRIFHCLFCLGYEDRGADHVGVLAVQGLAAMSALAIHMADDAAQLSKQELEHQLQTAAANSPFKIDSREIAGLVEDNGGSGVQVEFKDGSKTAVKFLINNPLTIPQGPFVQQLGLELEGSGDIKASPPAYQTTCRGVFAAGDCISPFKVAPHAIMTGNFAAVMAYTQLQAEKYGHASMV